jgi:hypothetical protein
MIEIGHWTLESRILYDNSFSLISNVYLLSSKASEGGSRG